MQVLSEETSQWSERAHARHYTTVSSCRSTPRDGICIAAASDALDIANNNVNSAAVRSCMATIANPTSDVPSKRQNVQLL
jgi:hypothetical protein